MKITRRGTLADHGPATIELKEPKFEWRSGGSNLVIVKAGVGDFSGKARHDYHVQVSASEICALLECLAVAAATAPSEIERALAPALKSTLQLTYIVSGAHSIGKLS